MKKLKLLYIKMARKGIIKLSDKEFLDICFDYYLGRKINWDSPKTFNEKLQWLKVNDRKDIYTTMVDKDKVKKYVSNIIGEEYIIPTLGVYDKFEDINFEELPNEFVIKCTQDSGGLVICKDKNKLNLKKARKKINKCLKINYYYNWREWPYKNVQPKIIIEKYMFDNYSKDILDYKFMCFNGQVKCSFICSDRRNEKGLAVDFFDREWNHMPFTRHYRNSTQTFSKPRNYELMIQLAEVLSKNIPFLRVDFYEINGKVYFGELTFYPGAGIEEFEPEEYDEILGDWIQINGEK